MSASGTIYLTISALIYTIITTILFQRKKKINKLENKIFTKITYPERKEQPMYDYNAAKATLEKSIGKNIANGEVELKDGCSKKKIRKNTG